MGNCLAVEEQVIRVMTMDGKLLEYRSPVRVDEVLSEYTDHALSDAFPVSNYMLANSKLVTGCLYYLVPRQARLTEPRKKKVRFSVPEVEGEGSTTVRVKLVISKKKLKEMIESGAVSIDRIVSEMQKEKAEDSSLDPIGDCHKKIVWKPVLNSITEAD